MAFEIGLIRVITLEDTAALCVHERILESAFPDLSVESRCIPDQPEGIHSAEMEALAVPKIVSLARSAFADKDMILVSCAEDPGVPEIRAALPGVPVVGAGEAAVGVAIVHGSHIGVLGIIDEAPKAYKRVLGEKLVANIRPEGVHCTLDLQTPQGRQSCVRAALQLKEMGADVIALGCTGLATIGIAPELEAATGLPVINPVLSMGAFATYEAAKKRAR